MQKRCWISKPGQCIITAGIWEANPLFLGMRNEFVKGTEGSQGRRVMQAGGMSEGAGLLPACCNVCGSEQGKDTLRAKSLFSFWVLLLRFCSVDQYRHTKYWISLSHNPDSPTIGKTFLF